MTSAITTTNINGDFPIAGQDNNSQGFRDNFTNIKTGLNTAKSEITALQTNTSKLNASNDFNGNIIENAEMLIHYISINYAPQQWTYIDIIYGVINSDLAFTLVESSIYPLIIRKTNLTNYVQSNDGTILPADRTSIMYGGYEHKRQIKRKNKTKSKTKSKKYNTKKRSNKHYKKHYKTRYRK